MKNLLVIVLGLIFIAVVIFVIPKMISEKGKVETKNQTQTATSQSSDQYNPDQSVKVLATNLDTPWAIDFLPDGSMLVTERAGKVRFISKEGQLESTPVATLISVREAGEGGLLGIAVDPDFAKNNQVYFYYTYASKADSTLNRVVKMTYINKQLTNEEIVVDAIPGAGNHNGGRIKFGPDKALYIGTGDAGEPSEAQNVNSLAGKILKVQPGSEVEVYSYGHRNVQGLAWDSAGNLWATEHGRSGIQSGLDEVNLIQKGKNYGWPTIQGNETRTGMETAVRNSGNTTWAPSGAAAKGNSLFFTGLRGQALYEAVLNGTQITEVKEHFSKEYGRIREVVVGPDGMLYITTSNKDGRGNPSATDDRVIKINLLLQ